MLLEIGLQNPLGSSQLRLWQTNVFTEIVALPPDEELLATLTTLVMLEEARHLVLLGIFNFNGLKGVRPHLHQE